MRYIKISIIIAVLLVAVPAGAGTWTLVQSEADGAVLSLAVVDQDKAIGFGIQKLPSGDDVPVWLQTWNGGQGWNVAIPVGHAPGAMVIVSDLACPSDQRCYALGTSIDMQTMNIKNFVTWSTDVGVTWTWSPNPNQWTNPTWGFARLSPVTAKELWVSNGANVVARSTNSGGTFQWKAVKDGSDNFPDIRDLSFVDSMVGFAVQGREVDAGGGKTTIEPAGAFLKTTDGGETWTALQRDAVEYPERVRFLDGNLGFVAGRTATGVFFRRTEDGGANWTELAIPAHPQHGASTWLADFHVFDRDTAFVATSGPVGSDQSFHVIWEMRDGSTLVAVDPDPMNNVGALTGMDCLNRNLCYLGGEKFAIMKYEGNDPIPGEDEGPVQGDHAGGGDLAGQDVMENEEVAATDQGPALDGYQPRDLAMYLDTNTGGGKGSCSSGAGGTTTVLALLAIGLAVLGIRRHGRQFRKPGSRPASNP